MEAAAKTFFASPRFAVAGASQDTQKFGYKGTTGSRHPYNKTLTLLFEFLHGISRTLFLFCQSIQSAHQLRWDLQSSALSPRLPRFRNQRRLL